MREKASICMCEDQTCSKCLLGNCKDKDCLVHTKERKDMRRHTWEIGNRKPSSKHILGMVLVASFTLTQVFAQSIELKTSMAPKVFVEKGDIFYSSYGKAKIQITTNGKDRAPLLSPDGKNIVFIRKSKNEAYSNSDGENTVKQEPDAALADQLWIIDPDGKNERILVKDHNPQTKGSGEFKVEDVVAFIDDKLQFSPDSKKVYFRTSAWTTTDALHSVNVDGTGEYFITSANYLQLIDKGEYKGDLIISQHRYFLGGGSYDWFYVFTPEGKEVGTLGDDLEQVNWNYLNSESVEEGVK